jgi:hypothetical protein
MAKVHGAGDIVGPTVSNQLGDVAGSLVGNEKTRTWPGWLPWLGSSLKMQSAH